jgi:hypothetical protein
MAIAGNRIGHLAPGKFADSSVHQNGHEAGNYSVTVRAVSNTEPAHHVLRNVQSLHRYEAIQLMA